MKRQNIVKCCEAVILKKIVKGKEIYKMNGFFLFTKVENYAIITKYMCTIRQRQCIRMISARWQAVKAVEDKICRCTYEQAEKQGGGFLCFFQNPM